MKFNAGNEYHLAAAEALVRDGNQNVLRGLIIQAVVRHVLKTGNEDTWGPYDAVLDDIKIEIKNSAEHQVWGKSKSNPRWDIAPKAAWYGAEFDSEIKRRADVYLFALFRNGRSRSQDVFDMDLWEFMALPTSAIDKELGKQKSLGLSTLKRLGALRSGLNELEGMIRRAATVNNDDGTE